ncbi:MAG: transglycosylase SLT domain-containing protein [Methylobacillus sp.]|jgi:soluble lytic murein transglycosylase|nr:transglycosylase SLT domain-containing protein [Methylobacillus sp.]
MQRFWWFVGVVLLTTGSAWGAADKNKSPSPQEDLLAARQAFNDRDLAALNEASTRLHDANYILAPYVDYWAFLLRLDAASKDEVRDFLSRNEEFPFVDRVRIEWLKKLGRRGDWATFLDELPRVTGDDAALNCYTAQARAASGEKTALVAARPLWFTSNALPDGCDALFKAMIKTGALTTEDIWQRVRLTLSEGKVSTAKSVAEFLPQMDNADFKLFDAVYDNPQRVLEKKSITTKTRFGRELNMYAVERVSRTQPDLALAQWQKLKSGYSDQDQQYMWGRMALSSAKRHDARALAWYDNAQDVDLTRDQIAWKARAALRVKNWDMLMSVIDAMPAAMRDEQPWQYWYGRALKEKGKLVQANKLWLPLSRNRTFYGLLAEEELGDTISMPTSTYKATTKDIKAMREIPGIQRALALNQLDMRWEARSEWSKVIKQLDDKQLIAAAEVAFREEWYDVAINTADKTTATHDFMMRYPTPYRDVMEIYVRENDLDAAWVYGLIRQESRFMSAARSSAGASGLMQLMPATAKWVAKQLGIKSYKANMVTQLDTNIQFGTHYLRHVLDNASDQALMATAAYNAGPGRATAWAEKEPLEGAIYAETIPFNETRDYVQKVMSNAHFYSYRLGTQTKTIKQRLGTIARGGATPDATQVEEKEKTEEKVKLEEKAKPEEKVKLEE